MDPTVVGALIGFGGSTLVQAVAGYVGGRRELRRLNETRLRELAQIVDAADRALTEARHHVNGGLSVAQHVGADGPTAGDRWQVERDDTQAQTVDDLSALWRHGNLLRVRVADGHPLMSSFEQAVSKLGEQTTAMGELLEPGSDRAQRKPAWDIARTTGDDVAKAQRDFEAAARELLGPRLERLPQRRSPLDWRRRKALER